jgi:altronate dehydratase large subunit
VSTVLCSSSVTTSIANATGTYTFTHQGGCGELGPELEHTSRVLEGVVTHPNIGGVLVVGLGCEQIDAENLKAQAQGKPAMYLRIHQEGGNMRAVEEGIKLVEKIKEQVAKTERTPVGVNKLILATQCGSSDTGSGIASNPAVGAMADRLIEKGGAVILGETGSLYGAAGLMARRAVSKDVGDRIIEITNVLERYNKRLGKSLREANPTPGNIKGGLTTLVEKSLGGVRKGGTTTIQGVLEPGEKIIGKGLWIMNTSKGLGACATADMLTSGAQIMVYTTGKGNPVGSLLGPVVKVTATKATVNGLSDVIDFDASPVLFGEETVKDCGDRLLDEVKKVADGKLVQSEKTGNNVFAIGNIVV